MQRRLRPRTAVAAVAAARPVMRGAMATVTARGGGTGAAAVVAGRRVGGAVDRNRAKRRLRAALALVEVPPELDIVVRASPSALRAPFLELCEDLRRTVRRAAAQVAP